MSRRIGFCLTGFFLFISILGLFWTPYAPEAMNISLKNAPPSYNHPFGNDIFGRDVLSRVMAGLSTSILISICVVAMGTVFGTILGAVTGYFGGFVDEVVMRCNDTLNAFPSILLALIFVSIYGSEKTNFHGSGKYYVVLALGILFIPSFARVVRSEYVKQRRLDYVKNAKVMRASHRSIIFRHMLPNMRSVLYPCITIAFNNAMLAEAGMSYLGLGVQPPEASLGRMISEASGYLNIAPWTAIFPGIVMVFVIYSVNLMGGDSE